jgi:methyl-accepting chemotaxis protein
VAAERRRLAESVLQSTREISGLIEDIRDATNAAVMATEAGVKATDAGAALSGRVGARLTSIVDFANQSSEAMQRIGAATGQQQLGTEQLVGAMADILRATRASADASGAMAQAHEELVELAQGLGRALADFAETRR